MKSVVQDWVSTLPRLRHQGVLLNALRGCDTSPKESPDKALTRVLRGHVLNAHVGDPSKARTYIEAVSQSEHSNRCLAVANNHDNLPHHYVMHLVHAAEILGYYHPGADIRENWFRFYFKMCRKLHVNMETVGELDARLCADETSFFAEQ